MRSQVMDATGRQRPDNAAPTNIKIIFLTLFLDLVGFSIIFPLFPAMLDYYLSREGTSSVLGNLLEWLQLGSGGSQTSSLFLTQVLFGGLLGSLYSLLQFFFAPIWGRYSDLHGRRRTLIITLAITSLGYFLWIFSGSFWVLLLSRIVSGVGSGNITVATAAVADVTGKRDRTKGMALVGVAFGVGFLAGPAIGGLASLIDLTKSGAQPLIFGLHPFSTPALVALVLSTINLAWVWTRFRETHPRGENGTVDADVGTARIGATFRRMSRSLAEANAVYFVFMTAFSGMEFTLTFLAVERLRYTPLENTRIFVFIALILIFVQGFLVRRLAPRLGEKPLVIAGLISAVCALYLLALAQEWITFFAGLTLLAVGVGFVSPTLTALVSLYGDESSQGRVLGGFRSAGSLGRVFGPIFAGAIFWHFGSLYAYLSGSVVLFVPLVLAFRLKVPQR